MAELIKRGASIVDVENNKFSAQVSTRNSIALLKNYLKKDEKKKSVLNSEIVINNDN